ncbi:PEPxxWA-CTERM sorting domain-containing protein [Sphingomonas sp. Tas61C01]|uniref:PEPxxWA-CTERM sorting domain-containing protein n=1 Tax=Sphingomonas sp. Tas61C01 TaxID=3458297 RepID=UPI00403EB846
MNFRVLGMGIASAVSCFSVPASAADFTLEPGATYALQVIADRGIFDGTTFTWDETSTASSLYRVELSYGVYPDQRYCDGGPIGCDTFINTDSALFTASGTNIARTFRPFVEYGGNYILDRAELRFVSLGSSNVGIRNLMNSNPAISLVPEPTTWAMVLIGFGMMGASMRYRRKSIAVSFA